METGMEVLSVCCNDLKMAVFLDNQYHDQYWRLYNLVDLSLAMECQIQTTNMVWSLSSRASHKGLNTS
jgi:hypothetical protein